LLRCIRKVPLCTWAGLSLHNEAVHKRECMCACLLVLLQLCVNIFCSADIFSGYFCVYKNLAL